MNSLDSFSNFLAWETVKIPVADFAINLVIAAVLGYGLSKVYGYCGRSLSNRGEFARNFLMLTMTTTLIISIVKSSLALSLGLVGALSIIRFRTAVKEPEELTYLFLCIGTGLGLGANQRMITLIAIGIIVAIALIRKFMEEKRVPHNMYLTVASSEDAKQDLESVNQTLKAHCRSVNLKRFDESQKGFEALFYVEFSDFKELVEGKNALRSLHPSIGVHFLDPIGAP